ncbi:hypothetical protein Salat_2084600 [Sesamum alatum]|uniref:Senescence regulator n=1 Tax=Sesamum alatum TaxID=300844 RepID=A0AAE2CGG3_9LAMI|nr:hypothetical protein Salat_2084600 [Sesamum alatum]
MEDRRGGGGPFWETEELQEEEVWGIMKPRREGSVLGNSNSKTRNNFVCSPSSSSWPIPRATVHGGGHQECSVPGWAERLQSSAPVDVPDWSKILKKRSKTNSWNDADHDDDDGGGDGVGHGKTDDDDDDEMVPPHEYLARRLASTQIASFSMCEGVGRTLKGRDLSKLRNAILTKTGFIE